MVVANGTVDPVSSTGQAIRELKARHTLGDAVEATGVALRGKGRVRQGVCPFHKEVEDSFTVYGDSQRFYCFGCGAGGDVLDFVQKTEGLTLPEAIRRLDDGAVPAPMATRRPTLAPHPSASPFPPRDPALLTSAVRFYAGELRCSPRARTYLASRGIGPDAAKRLGLGYSSDNGLRDYLNSAGFGADRQRASGLFLERGAERFGGMITVPDTAHGLVRWLTGRAVDPQPPSRVFRRCPAPSRCLASEGSARRRRWWS